MSRSRTSAVPCPAASRCVRDPCEMARTSRSRTAQGVAAERAVLAGMGVIADPFAQDMIGPAMGGIVWLVRQLPNRVRARSATLAGLAARVLWFDAQVVGAIEAGLGQIAVIGAGYDSRAWRFRRDDVRFFELDLGATQRDKMSRAPGPGPTYVEADLGTDCAAEALQRHGLDSSRPALFLVEGVTMYLVEASALRQLRELAASSAVGSRLAVDFYPPHDAGTSRNNRQRLLQRLSRIGSGEGFRLLVDRRAAVGLVESSGWKVEQATSIREAARVLVGRDAGLPIESVNEHKTLVAAIRAGEA